MLTEKQRRNRQKVVDQIITDIERCYSLAHRLDFRLPDLPDILSLRGDEAIDRVKGMRGARDKWVRKCFRIAEAQIGDDADDLDIGEDEAEKKPQPTTQSKPDSGGTKRRILDLSKHGKPDAKGWQHVWNYTGPESIPEWAEKKNVNGTVYARELLAEQGRSDKGRASPAKQSAAASQPHKETSAAFAGNGSAGVVSVASSDVPLSSGGEALAETKDINLGDIPEVRVELPTDESIGWALSQYAGKKIRVIPTNKTLPTLPGAVPGGVILDCSEVEIIDGSDELRFEHDPKSGLWRAPAPQMQFDNVYDGGTWYAYEHHYRDKFQEDQPQSDLYIDGEPCTFGPRDSLLVDGNERNDRPYWWTDKQYIYLKERPQGEARISVRSGGLGSYFGDGSNDDPTKQVERLSAAYAKGNNMLGKDVLEEFMQIPVDMNFTLANAKFRHLASNRDAAAVMAGSHKARGWRIINSTIDGCAGHGFEFGFDCRVDSARVINPGHNAFHPYGGSQDLHDLHGENINWKANSWGWGASLIKFYPQLPFTHVTMDGVIGYDVFANVIWFDFLELVDKITLRNVQGANVARDLVHDELSHRMIAKGIKGDNINYVEDSVANGYSGAACRVFNAPDATIEDFELTNCHGGGILGYNLLPAGDPDVGYRSESGKTSKPGGKRALASNLRVRNGRIHIARRDFNIPHRDAEGSMMYGMNGVLNDGVEVDPSSFIPWEGVHIEAPHKDRRKGTPWAVGKPHASDEEFEAAFMGNGSKVTYT